MRYRCLILDHDDTAVDSTPSIHYPAHLAQMRHLERSEESLSLEEWFKVNYSPGLTSFLDETLGLNDGEKRRFYEIWREFTTASVPPFFPGILPFLKRFCDAGGILVVVSHSEADIIRSHYENQSELPGFIPDRIIGWDGDPNRNKPNPWPVETVLKEFDLRRDEVLVVDDLQPGITMAKRAGVDSLAVGWSHRLPEIKEDISKKSTYYAENLEELETLIFGQA